MDVVKSKILWSRKKRITRVSRLHSTLHFPTRIALRAVVRKREPRGSLREEIFFREEYWGGKAVGWKKVFIIILFNTKKLHRWAYLQYASTNCFIIIWVSSFSLLFGRTRSRGRCWATNRLSHHPESSVRCCSSTPARSSKPPQECNAWCQLFAKWLKVSAILEGFVQHYSEVCGLGAKG